MYESVFVQDMFEKVNQAYEFLCSKSKITEGPDPKNIVLILKAQTILFSRYKEGDGEAERYVFTQNMTEH